MTPSQNSTKVVGIHQPNFLPWLGFFDKIAKSDVFVLIDNVQFVKGHICNRNKIKNNQSEAVWITVPVSHEKGTDVNFNRLPLAYEQNWGTGIINQIRGSYGGAPYFDRYMEKLSYYFIESEYDSLGALNIALIKFCCQELGISTKLEIASQIDEEFGTNNDLNIGICKYFDADTYLSGQGAKKYNDEDQFEKAAIKLKYQQFDHPEYKQLFEGFIPNLSVIDLLINEGPDAGRFFELS
ncbi:WbqC family protein [Gracilimonas sp.]|uniref:WbqC family protein n=1 Tax=Gracilimonas sp. TaxID=1974203 RepID=UPI003BA92871